VWRIGIWGDGIETVFGGFQQFGALFDGFWKPVVSHHIQIYVLVHGTTTCDNCATISLYGYDLA
jgi:hypothetical protein